jgi:hypothetical protein
MARTQVDCPTTGDSGRGVHSPHAAALVSFDDDVIDDDCLLFFQQQSDAPWLNRRRPGSLYSIINYKNTSLASSSFPPSLPCKSTTWEFLNANAP